MSVSRPQPHPLAARRGLIWRALMVLTVLVAWLVAAPPPAEAREPAAGAQQADSDVDGLEDATELYRLRTNRLQADTDGDGTGDAVEAIVGRDPLRPTDAAVLPPPPPPSLLSDRCDSTVNNAAELLAAAASAENEGRVVCARAGRYQGLRFENISHPVKVTLRAYPGERVTLGQSVVLGVQGLRFEGFRMPEGGFDLQPSDNERIEIVGNDIGRCECFGVIVWDGSRDILIEGNWIHDMRRPSASSLFWMGYGISSRGGLGSVENLRIVRNTIERTQNDALEIGSTHGGEITGNVIREAWPAGCSPARPECPDGSEHTDGLMYWSGSSGFTIRDNRFTDNRQGWLLSGGSHRTVIENNLLARTQSWCVDAGETGSSDAGIHHFTFRRNTFYDCGRDFDEGGLNGRYGLLIRGDSSDTNTLDRNVLASLEADGTPAISASDRNDTVHGYRGASSDVGIVPRFADETTYLPTNLPFQAGYREAPAGAP